MGYSGGGASFVHAGQGHFHRPSSSLRADPDESLIDPRFPGDPSGLNLEDDASDCPVRDSLRLEEIGVVEADVWRRLVGHGHIPVRKPLWVSEPRTSDPPGEAPMLIRRPEVGPADLGGGPGTVASSFGPSERRGPGS